MLKCSVCFFSGGGGGGGRAGVMEAGSELVRKIWRST